MSEIDAAELARLREMAKEMLDVDPSQFEAVVSFEPSVVLSLIDALEKARGDLEMADETIGKLNSGAELQELMRLNNEAIAERDSARALLRECNAEFASLLEGWKLHARISVELETKP